MCYEGGRRIRVDSSFTSISGARVGYDVLTILLILPRSDNDKARRLSLLFLLSTISSNTCSETVFPRYSIFIHPTFTVFTIESFFFLI
ncbi:hypothetical protein L1887_36828 [Cichorium endivia]|nr:hypothetical protein L1887_36828 [Cichorium endivia]